jgi:hypothetical protein
VSVNTGEFTPHEWARRLSRSRTWFLYQAGAARLRANEALAEAARAEGHAASLEVQLREMGIDPHAPAGPRPA